MRRSGFNVMARLVGLVKPLTGFMVLAVAMGLLGHLCAAFITIFAGVALLHLDSPWPFFAGAAVFALVRGFLRYGEQRCNHFIAFKLLALLRDRVFSALRRLCPAKLEGRDKGDLIALITSDIELLEVFYAHTISPIAIAALFSGVMTCFIGSFHPLLGLLALVAYGTVGVAIPMLTAKLGGDDGLRFRHRSGELSAFVLDSIRGLPEIIQFGCAEARLAGMNARSDDLAADEARMKHTAGINQAATNAAILMFDIAMLFASAALCGFEGCVLATLAMMSSFGPTVALAALGAHLAEYIRSRKPGAGYSRRTCRSGGDQRHGGN